MSILVRGGGTKTKPPATACGHHRAGKTKTPIGGQSEKNAGALTQNGPTTEEEKGTAKNFHEKKPLN